MRDPTGFLGKEYQELVDKALDWREPMTRVDGRDVLVLCANNYLGLATHPKLKQAAAEAIEKYGVGSGAVRAISGNMDVHVELEERLAHQ